jgi:hypothetical protein
LHWQVAWTRAALALVAAGAVGLALVSGGSPADPRTPAGLPGLPPPFLGTAAIGSGGMTAAIDAYGDVVDLRTLGPAGRALIDNPAERQAAGTVAANTGIVPRVRLRGQDLPLWRAELVQQRYRPGTNVLVTEAMLGTARVEVIYAVHDDEIVCLTHTSGPRVSVEFEEPALGAKLRCDDSVAQRLVHIAERSDRHWLSQARPLGAAAPIWARRLYQRSLLALRALTDRRTGAVAAGARDGWAYVWPRDAGTAALAFAVSGYRPEARRIARFLLGLDLGAAARFHGDGTPVAGREAQGDAAGWVAVTVRAAGLASPTSSLPWRDRADYQEGEPSDYLANAIGGGATSELPAGAIAAEFGTERGLARRAGDPGSGLDSAAAWAVRPFALPALYPAVRRTLLALAARRTRFGVTPGDGWEGTDPWTAPTAWMAWSLAVLSDREQRQGSGRKARHDRRTALGLLGDLRRAATPAGALPERVDARTGVPASTTPLAWSHAFAILTLRQLWPDRSKPKR